jgi:hypothetical protein
MDGRPPETAGSGFFRMWMRVRSMTSPYQHPIIIEELRSHHVELRVRTLELRGWSLSRHFDPALMIVLRADLHDVLSINRLDANQGLLCSHLILHMCIQPVYINTERQCRMSLDSAKINKEKPRDTCIRPE